jgi:hypothetical protein
LVVSEIDVFIFERYSSYKHEYGGDNGNEGLEVQHLLFILDYPILTIFGDRQTRPPITVYSPNSDRQLNRNNQMLPTIAAEKTSKKKDKPRRSANVGFDIVVREVQLDVVLMRPSIYSYSSKSIISSLLISASLNIFKNSPFPKTLLA